MTASELLIFAKANPPQVKPMWVDSFEQMAVHSRKYSADKLLKDARPSEPEEIRKYRVKTDQPITHASINEAIIRAAKVIHNSNYSFDVSDELNEYLSNNFLFEFDAKGTPDSIAFIDVMFNRAFRFMCETGNGFIAWIPINSENNNLPPSLQPPTEPVTLGYSIVEPKNIIWLDNNYCIFELKNKHKLEGKNSATYHSKYMYVDKFKYILLEPTYNGKDEIVYNEVLWYNIAAADSEGNYSIEDAADTIPVVITKGYATYDEHSNLYYESYFSGFVPLANEARIAYSDDKAVRLINNFPIREEKEEECNHCHGTGKIDGKTCGSCNGTGFKSAKSPFSVYKKRPPAAGDDAEWAKVPALSYIEPPVQALEHSFKTWQFFLDKAEQKVNIKFIDDAQSGVAKDIDREGLIDLRLAIANNFFDNIFYKSLWICEILFKPNSNDRVEPIVNKPTAQDLNYKSTSQLLKDLQEYSSGNVPHFIGNMKLLDAVSKLFPDDADKVKTTKVLMYVDPFFGWSEDEANKVVQNSATKNARIIHLYAEPELRKMIIEDETVLEKDVIEIAKLLEQRLQIYLTDPLMEITNLFPNGTQ